MNNVRRFRIFRKSLISMSVSATISTTAHNHVAAQKGQMTLPPSPLTHDSAGGLLPTGKKNTDYWNCYYSRESEERESILHLLGCSNSSQSLSSSSQLAAGLLGGLGPTRGVRMRRGRGADAPPCCSARSPPPAGPPPPPPPLSPPPSRPSPSPSPSTPATPFLASASAI